MKQETRSLKNIITMVPQSGFEYKDSRGTHRWKRVIENNLILYVNIKTGLRISQEINFWYTLNELYHECKDRVVWSC